LLRVAGIDLHLHWSWFVVAVIELSARTKMYSSLLWNVLEYLSLFLIVLLHEFGHALACRQVGGTANTILLWPLGGVAYVDPPQRPGPVLWSIAAGPLVNVALIPVFLGLGALCRSAGLRDTMPDAHAFLRTAAFINLGLLIFNLLPVYPLDGGQIVRALLWFVLGRARSLMVASSIGFVGVAALGAIAVWLQSFWIGIIAIFVLMSCLQGLRQARALARLAQMERRPEFVCPSCKASPPVGPVWLCQYCRAPFDTFASGAVCPHCGAQFDAMLCVDCGKQHPLGEWVVGAPN
jgi:Zn-dependent protease